MGETVFGDKYKKNNFKFIYQLLTGLSLCFHMQHLENPGDQSTIQFCNVSSQMERKRKRESTFEQGTFIFTSFMLLLTMCL